jgi:hypothetical protein
VDGCRRPSATECGPDPGPAGEPATCPTDLRDFYELYIEALNAHEFDGMDEFVHESIVMHSEPSSRAALVAQLNSITDAVPDFHWETRSSPSTVTASPPV